MTPVAVGPADAEALAVLHATAFPAAAAWDARTIATLLGLSGVFGLRKEDKGFILARHVLDEAEILTLAVRPAAGRRGVGAALVGCAAEMAAALGAARMFLEVAEANAAALALYRGLGFEDIGLRRDYYAKGSHARLLRRWLKRPPS